MLILEDRDIEQLASPGFFILDAALDSAAIITARLAAEQRLETLHPAGTGRGKHRDEAVRGDRIRWLSNDEAAFTPLFETFEAVRKEASEKAFLGLRSFEVQLAHYPGGGERYVRHRDAFEGDDNRRLTAIIYLNEGWRTADGGQLVLHAADRRVEVAPVGGRLVVFTSSRVEHEVLPSLAPRWAVTAWFRAR